MPEDGCSIFTTSGVWWARGIHYLLSAKFLNTKVMPKTQLTRLFWEALDRLAYAVMDARLWLFELMHGAPRESSAGGFDRVDSHPVGAASIDAFLLAGSLPCSGTRQIEPMAERHA